MVLHHYVDLVVVLRELQSQTLLAEPRLLNVKRWLPPLPDLGMFSCGVCRDNEHSSLPPVGLRLPWLASAHPCPAQPAPSCTSSSGRRAAGRAAAPRIRFARNCPCARLPRSLRPPLAPCAPRYRARVEVLDALFDIGAADLPVGFQMGRCARDGRRCGSSSRSPSAVSHALALTWSWRFCVSVSAVRAF